MQGEIINRMRSAIEYVEADKAQDYADAETTGERVDLNNYDVSLSLEDAKALESALSNAVAEIVSAHGDPEAFGERELVALVDIQKFPYRTKLYALPDPTNPPALSE
ncbi:MAG TPA: hypothetical protein DCW88_10520 [Agrobacterium sp.]|uniref:hypothetical protein n=1 Tax=Agrobacterium pusense TaxID=648995 RepID=UPI000E861E5E|nr:hypothetical protein [Agrobacterium sp.]